MVILSANWQEKFEEVAAITPYNTASLGVTFFLILNSHLLVVNLPRRNLFLWVLIFTVLKKEKHVVGRVLDGLCILNI